MLRFLVLLAFCTSAFSIHADNAAPVARLSQLLDGMRSIRSSFTQDLLDEQGEVIQHSSGTLQLSHPSRFRWLTEAPFEQLVVSDGDTVWQYDPDLMQVVIRPLDRRADQLPSLLLGGDIDAVGEHYAIRADDNTAADDEAFVLEPLSADDLFSALHIRFHDGELASMVITDGFGQRTEVRFSSVQTVQVFTEDTFRFIVPAGVDVIHDD